MTIRFDNQVAIVTGAGNGLGKQHAIALAARGAKVVVNDFGGARDGTGGSSAPADEVVNIIRSNGGEAIANAANVADFGQVSEMVGDVLSKWGRVDVLINNAGILRDKSFAKMDMADFQTVVDVHLMGSAYCSKAVWETMREQQYGRIVMTTSSSGLYGNFGQANYGAAKLAVVGLMNTLVLEGAKYNIKVNCLAPAAGTRMLEDIIPDRAVLDLLAVESVTPGLLTLCDEEAPNRTILCAGAGGYAVSKIYETDGVFLAKDQQTPEAIRANLAQITASDGQQALDQGGLQTAKFLEKAQAHYKNS